MSANGDGLFDMMIRKFERLANLTDQDRAAIRTLPHRVANYSSNHLLVSEGELRSECCLLLKGYACRFKETSSEDRQIVSFHMPGDLLDQQHLMLPRADHGVLAITDVVTAWLPAKNMRELLQDYPAINEALWRDALIDASIFREWVLNVGRRDAKARIAHMLCEFAARREAAGLGSAARFELPMTQEHIADATGMTSIHVNRTLFALAKEGLIARDKRFVEIIDWDRMRRAADFDPAYLHAAA